MLTGLGELANAKTTRGTKVTDPMGVAFTYVVIAGLAGGTFQHAPATKAVEDGYARIQNLKDTKDAGKKVFDYAGDGTFSLTADGHKTASKLAKDAKAATATKFGKLGDVLRRFNAEWTDEDIDKALQDLAKKNK